MKIKFLTNFFLIIIFTYIPVFLSSIFLLKIENNNISYNSNLSEREINKEELIKSQKIESIKKGYLPFYHPCETKNYARNSKFYPIGSLPNTNTYYCDEGYGLIKYRTDRFGLRNKDKNWDEINKSNNIFLIGDSFIQGACVPEEWKISTQIQYLTINNVINLGSSCNCPYEYIALLKSTIYPIIKNSNKKNNVILTFYDNDNIYSNRIDDSHIKNLNNIIKIDSYKGVNPSKEYIKFIDKLIKENYAHKEKDILKEIKNPTLKLSDRKWKESFLYKSLTLYPIRKRLKLNPSPSEKAIKLLSKVCSNKCTPHVAYIPNSSLWRENMTSNKYKKNLIRYSKKSSINFIDTENIIDKNSLIDYSPYGPHLSKKGYKKIGKYIFESIK